MSDAPAPRSVPARRVSAVLVAALLALGLVVATSLPASAAASCDGVTVRVERGGRSSERCAPGDPATGLDALEDAGHRYTFVPGQPGMVCTIDGYPDPCNDAPADAYWSYWHAEAGATSWTYATRGAGNRNPAPGTHEAWVFGAGTQPSAPPPSTTPSPKPTPSPTESKPPASGDGSSDGSGDGSGSDGSSSGDGGAVRDPGPSADTRSNGNGTGGSGGSDGSSDGAGGDDGGERGDDDVPTDPADRTEPPAEDDPADDEAAEDETTDDEAVDGDEDPADDEDPDAAATETDDDARPEALDDPVTIDTPEGGRSGTAATVAAFLVVGLGTAGVLRARARRDEFGTDA